MIDEVREHLSPTIADGDGSLVPRNDPYGDCLVGHALHPAIQRDAKYGQEPLILALGTWTLIYICDIGEELPGDP